MHKKWSKFSKFNFWAIENISPCDPHLIYQFTIAKCYYLATYSKQHVMWECRKSGLIRSTFNMARPSGKTRQWSISPVQNFSTIVTYRMKTINADRQTRLESEYFSKSIELFRALHTRPHKLHIASITSRVGVIKIHKWKEILVLKILKKINK